MQRGLPIGDKKLIVLSVLLAVILIELFVFRAELSLFAWEEFRVLPATALALNKDAELAVELGNYYFRWRGVGAYDLDRAEHFYAKAIEIDREVFLAWYQLARIDFLRGNFQSGLYKINKQLEIHGDDPPNVYYIRGLVYGYDEQFKNAENDFLAFISLEPDTVFGRVDLGWVYFSQGEFKKAAGVAYEGLAFESDNPWLLTLYGTSLLNLDRSEDAQVVLEAALIEAQGLTAKDWEQVYPGNDPKVAQRGLNEMITAIEHNLSLTVHN